MKNLEGKESILASLSNIEALKEFKLNLWFATISNLSYKLVYLLNLFLLQ